LQIGHDRARLKERKDLCFAYLLWGGRPPIFDLIEEHPMIARSELAVVCRPLEDELQKAGFAFGDVQFDEAVATLRIILIKRPPPGAATLVQADFVAKDTIDVRLLWDVLRDLNHLGVANPAIQLREGDQGECQARQFVAAEDPRLFSGRDSKL
jgi:hypothetical protein